MRAAVHLDLLGQRGPTPLKEPRMGTHQRPSPWRSRSGNGTPIFSTIAVAYPYLVRGDGADSAGGVLPWLQLVRRSLLITPSYGRLTRANGSERKKKGLRRVLNAGRTGFLTRSAASRRLTRGQAAANNDRIDSRGGLITRRQQPQENRSAPPLLELLWSRTSALPCSPAKEH